MHPPPGRKNPPHNALKLAIRTPRGRHERRRVMCSLASGMRAPRACRSPSAGRLQPRTAPLANLLQESPPDTIENNVCPAAKQAAVARITCRPILSFCLCTGYRIPIDGAQDFLPADEIFCAEPRILNPDIPLVVHGIENLLDQPDEQLFVRAHPGPLSF